MQMTPNTPTQDNTEKTSVLVDWSILAPASWSVSNTQKTNVFPKNKLKIHKERDQYLG